MRRFRAILKWAGISLLALIVAGGLYEAVGLLLDSRLAPPATEMVLLNGHHMHLVCEGRGRETFVLDAGAGAGTFEWWRLQPKLASLGRVCAYDRQGLGWSEPTESAHDGATAADTLAALVRVAGIARPFVYVGHSLGANFAMIYYARHTQDVAALVLLEPGIPKDLLEDFRGTRQQAMGAPDCSFTCRAIATAAYLGIPRLAAAVLVNGHKNLAGRARDDYLAGLGRPSTVRALASEYIDALPKTAYEDLDVKGFGKTPVLTVASSALREPEGKETVEDVKRWRAGQLAYLASLAKRSPRGQGPLIVPDSTHASMVMGERQSMWLAGAIANFLKQARQKS